MTSSVEPQAGRASLTDGYPVCTGGFGHTWHEPVNMAIVSAERIGFSDRQHEKWRCPTCWQDFECDAPERVTRGVGD